MRAIPAKRALAYENGGKLAKNTLRQSFSSVLKPRSRDVMQSRLPEELALENTLRCAEHVL